MEDTHNQLLDMVRQYQMPRAAIELLTAYPPLVLAGATASGKDAIAQRLETSSDWRLMVTHTTRPIRPGELNGKNHWFVSEAEMLALLEQAAFIEAKLLHNIQCMGSSITAYQAVIDGGKKPIMRIDIQGVETLLENGLAIRPFFILPPSFEVWMERLDKRGHMSHVERVHRLRSAELELEKAIRNDKFILVINDDVSRVSQEIIQGYTDAASQHSRRELAKQLIDHIKAF